ncbi:hypothetical protein B0H12DRAFT_592451 [Mycena haematopus]|nr:hypothetical protein B0H12DRAFT_592451 [Mycena haematopus]
MDFPSLLASEGIIYIDKSLSIMALDCVLQKNKACIVTLPTGTGKTFIMSMLLAWYDRKIGPDERDKLFLHLGIGPELRMSKLHRKVCYSAGQHFCLLFDLGRLRYSGATNVARMNSINTYLCETLSQFIAKYNNELDFSEFDFSECVNPEVMMNAIVSFHFWMARATR